jgi:hypothetical protein
MNNLIRTVSFRSKTKIIIIIIIIRWNNGQPAKHNGSRDKKADKKIIFLIFNYFLIFLLIFK